MKIESIKEKVGGAIALAEKITSKTSTLPVLKCLFLQVENSRLIIKATNLDLGIEIDIPVKASEEGSVAVPAGILNSFVSSIGAEKNISLEIKEGNLKVSTHSHQTLIKAYPHEDFPSIPRVEGGKKIIFSTKELINGFKSVWYSASVSNMKPELSSVFIYPDGDEVVFVATDSFRLAEKRVKVKNKKDFSQILIPFRNIPEIIRVLEQAETGEVELSLSKNQLSFSLPGIHLFSRVVDGVFPDYKQIIPKETTTEAIVLKQDLINALKIANIFSNNFNQISFKISPKNKTMELASRNGEVGESQDKLEAVLKGEEIEISFNYKYINDCFQAIAADSLLLSFGGQNKPLLVRGVNDKSFLYLVSPMNK